MFYQLTMQFSTAELENAKKILDLAKDLDIEHANAMDPIRTEETFAWEQEEKKAEEIQKTTEEVKEETPEFTFEELRGACKDYALKHGKEALKALFEQMGARKLIDVPEERHTELWSALNA